MTITQQTDVRTDSLTEKLERFLRKPSPRNLGSLLAHMYRKLNFQLARPVRLPFGGWVLAWPDVMGHSLRNGAFEENEWQLVRRLLRPGMTVLDVGAHIGFYTLLAARQLGNTGRVVAFEPSFRERSRLRRNLTINRCHNVRVEPLALGDHNGQTDFFVVLGQETGCNSLRPPVVADSVTRVKVPVMTLDNYLSQRRIPAVDFIKLDAEGAELAILKGASGLLTMPLRPIVMCELADMRTEPWNYKAQEIYKILAEAGYVWFSVVQGGYLCMAPEQDRYHENLVAVAQERLSEISDWIVK